MRDLASKLTLRVEDDTIRTRRSCTPSVQHILSVSHRFQEHTSGVRATRPQRELLVRPVDGEVKALVVVVLVRVRRAAGLAVRVVVLVPRGARAGYLRVGVACRAALDVAGAGLDWGVGDGEGESEGREEEERCREEVHGCGWIGAKVG
jgi:hypothetical protein